MKSPRSVFVRYVAIPQDHGSWVFLLSPLVVGIFAGGRFTLASACLVVGAVAAFMLRQPMTVAVKALSGRRSRTDLPAAGFWIAVYMVAALLATVGIILLGDHEVLYLAIPGIPVFIWHLYLVNRHAERKQAGVEVIASGVLALAAPAAYWIGSGSYPPLGWMLWLLIWLQSAASIVHVYLRLDQRIQPEVPPRSVRWQMGRRALLYTSFNLILTIAGSLSGFLAPLLFLPFSVQWLETLWGITHPAVRVKPTRIGIRQLIVSTLFTVLFVVMWGQ